MPGNAHLARQDAVFANLGGAGDSRLGSHHGVVSHNHVVGNLAQVVYADAVAYDGAFHLGAVHGGVGAYFNIVPDYNIAKVLYLFPASVRPGGVTEAVGPYDAAGVEDHIVADNRTGIDHHSGIDEAVLADGHIFVDMHVGMDVGAVSHLCA